MAAILPPSMLGILGGGQLGRMFAVAAKTMGYRVTVLDPDSNAPAAQFADVHLCAPFNDADALKTLAQTCAAVTTEFENVNADAMRELARTTRVSPSGDCVAIAQDRIAEKAWINKAGLPTAPYLAIESVEDIQVDLTPYLPGILKTARWVTTARARYGSAPRTKPAPPMPIWVVRPVCWKKCWTSSWKSRPLSPASARRRWRCFR
jgi:5-(carboxyamino)imidazole ribonucleotide synthase